MMRDIDVARLSLRDTLDLAVLIEEDARQRYLELADQVGRHHTREAADFFRRMAATELTHATRLRERRRTLFADSEITVDRSLAFEVEAPEYHQIRAFMTLHEALEVALESERKAYRFYDQAMKRAEDAEVQRLFDDLRKQEAEHQQQILEYTERLPAEDDTDPDDYVDEPQPM